MKYLFIFLGKVGPESMAPCRSLRPNQAAALPQYAGKSVVERRGDGVVLTDLSKKVEGALWLGMVFPSSMAMAT